MLRALSASPARTQDAKVCLRPRLATQGQGMCGGAPRAGSASWRELRAERRSVYASAAHVRVSMLSECGTGRAAEGGDAVWGRWH